MTSKSDPPLGIVEMPEPLGLYAGRLFNRAKEFQGAFDALTDGRTEIQYPFPSYFLIAHAIELFLKSFLAAKGLSKRDLTKLEVRHNATRLMELASGLGLPHVENLSEVASIFHEMNKDHDLRYPSAFRISLPRPEICLKVTRALDDTIAPIVSQAAIRAQIRWAADTRHLKGVAEVHWSD